MTSLAALRDTVPLRRKLGLLEGAPNCARLNTPHIGEAVATSGLSAHRFNWGAPTGAALNFNSGQFGRITTRAGDPRIMQFGVKYDF